MKKFKNTESAQLCVAKLFARFLPRPQAVYRRTAGGLPNTYEASLISSLAWGSTRAACRACGAAGRCFESPEVNMTAVGEFIRRRRGGQQVKIFI